MQSHFPIEFGTFTGGRHVAVILVVDVLEHGMKGTGYVRVYHVRFGNTYICDVLLGLLAWPPIENNVKIFDGIV